MRIPGALLWETGGEPHRDEIVVSDEICRKRGLPWLTPIAVNATTRRPGDSFLPEGVAQGRDEERMWRGTVLQVFAYDWAPIEFRA